jgi:signal transduction histidine kinase
MDLMMTFGNLVVTWLRRMRLNWPAVVLPAVAAEMIPLFRGHHTTSGAVAAGLEAVLWLAVALTVLAPAAAARIAPFALFCYGCAGLLSVHFLLVWRIPMVSYGFVTLPHGNGHLWIVLLEAFAFIVASVWLLAVTGGPAGRAVRQAARQLLGTGGQARTVPALLLLPVIGLWEEAYANPLWFGSAAGELAALMILLVGVTLVVMQPRLAAVMAVLGLVGLGLDLLICALNGAPYFIVNAIRGPAWFDHPGFPASGVFSGLYGPVLLINGTSVVLIKAEGVLLILAGCLLAPRMRSWAADAELARRAAVLGQRIDRLTRTRSDATSTAVAELRRIERDLHDGAQARLVALGMALRAAEQLMGDNPAAAQALVAEARETSSRALDDLRGLVRGIYPPVLADRGLGDAVRALALDTPLTVQTDIALPGEPPMPVAAAVYFGIAEALTNAVRHAGADTVQITIGYAGLLRVTVTDDGTGGADPSRGTGLAGVERRLATFDGVLAVSSPPGGPTIVAIEVPCTLTDDTGRVARPARPVIG